MEWSKGQFKQFFVLRRKSEVGGVKIKRQKFLKTYIKHPCSHAIARHSDASLYVLLVLSQ